MDGLAERFGLCLAALISWPSEAGPMEWWPQRHTLLPASYVMLGTWQPYLIRG